MNFFRTGAITFFSFGSFCFLTTSLPSRVSSASYLFVKKEWKSRIYRFLNSLFRFQIFLWMDLSAEQYGEFVILSLSGGTVQKMTVLTKFLRNKSLTNFLISTAKISMSKSGCSKNSSPKPMMTASSFLMSGLIRLKNSATVVDSR